MMAYIKTSIICLIFMSSQAIANNSLIMSLNKYYQLNKSNPEIVNTYISGLLSGYRLTNVMLENKGKEKLYCLPKGTTIKVSGIKSILGLGVSLFKETENHKLLNSDIGSYTLSTLIDTYPCIK